MIKLDIKVTAFYINSTTIQCSWEPASILYNTAIAGYTQQITIGTLDTPNNVFPTIKDCWDFYYDANAASILSMVNTIADNTYELGERVFYDQPIDDDIKLKQTSTDSTSALAAMTLASNKMLYAAGPTTFGAFDTTSYGRGVMNVADGAALASKLAPSFGVASSKSFNTAFQVSATKNAYIFYSIQIAATLSLTSGQNGTVSLQICATSGGTFVEIGKIGNGNTGTLTIGINTVQTQIYVLPGYVPAGYYVKLVSTNVTGTPTFTFITGQEVLY